MNKFPILALMLCLFSCKKSSTPNPGPNNPNPSPQTVYYDLPNWVSDTLTTLIDINTMTYDTLYSLTSNGKAYIKHHGVQYYIRVWVLSHESFSDSTGWYKYDLYNMNGTPVNDTSKIDPVMVITTSKKYDKAYSNWVKTIQFIGVPHMPPFPQTATGYQGRPK